MYIAFKCYDVNNDQSIDRDEVSIMMKNIPVCNENRYGTSFNTEN